MITAVGVPPITRDGAREAAQRELSKSIYHRYDDPWPVRAFKAVEHWIGSLFDTVARHSPGGGAGAAALLIALVALLVIARRRLGPMQRRARVTHAVLTEHVTTAAEHRRAAAAAAAAGRWSEAVVAGMRALARQLEEQGDLEIRPGRTADELAREVAAGRPGAATAVGAAAATFDAVAYGGRTGDETGYRAIVAADEAVRDRRTLAGSWA